MVLRVILLLLLLGGLTTGTAQAAPSPSRPPIARDSAPLSDAPFTKPRATLSAATQTLVSGNVGVWVRSNAKKVALTYRQAGRAREATISVDGGAGTKTLGAGASMIHAKAMPTATRRASLRISIGALTWKRQLRIAARQDTFFGHQSVGYNILDGVSSVYTKAGVAAPSQISGIPMAGGSIGEVTIGTNGDPDSKLDDFEDWLRNRGAADASDVALMKLCFIDIGPDFDAKAWFKKYRARMSQLEKDFPAVTFLHATAPLTTDTPDSNVARQKLNRLLRAEYGPSGRLFDLAVVESTRPNGSRVGGKFDGKKYFAMYDGYTSDGGHLNETGGAAAATELVHVIARAVRL